MNEVDLKQLLIRDKFFLKQLYSGPNIVKNKTILMSSEDSELNTLLKYLHFVANGKITILKKNFLKIKKKLNLIRTKVENESKLLKLLNSNRQEKIQFLLKINDILPYLLYRLFNLK